MTHEPAADDHAGAAAARPAMDVHRAAGLELGVDRIERRCDDGGRRHPEVADRNAERPSTWNEGGIRRKLGLLGEVDEQGDSVAEEPTRTRVRRPPTKRMGDRPRAGVPARSTSARAPRSQLEAEHEHAGGDAGRHRDQAGAPECREDHEPDCRSDARRHEKRRGRTRRGERGHGAASAHSRNATAPAPFACSSASGRRWTAAAVPVEPARAARGATARAIASGVSAPAKPAPTRCVSSGSDMAAPTRQRGPTAAREIQASRRISASARSGASFPRAESLGSVTTKIWSTT